MRERQWIGILLLTLAVLGSCSDGAVADLEAEYGPGSTSTTVPDATTTTPADEPDVTSTTTTRGPRDGSVFSLEVGVCFDDPSSDGAVDSVPIVDCATPHDNEVYDLFDLADGEYPGDDEVGETARNGCLASFDSFVGRDYASSELDLLFLTPTGESWSQGDREVVCFVYRVDIEKMTGSMQDTGM